MLYYGKNKKKLLIIITIIIITPGVNGLMHLNLEKHKSYFASWILIITTSFTAHFEIFKH